MSNVETNTMESNGTIEQITNKEKIQTCVHLLKDAEQWHEVDQSLIDEYGLDPMHLGDPLCWALFDEDPKKPHLVQAYVELIKNATVRYGGIANAQKIASWFIYDYLDEGLREEEAFYYEEETLDRLDELFEVMDYIYQNEGSFEKAFEQLKHYFKVKKTLGIIEWINR